MEKEIHERASFETIRYANCWEDTEILIKSLNIKEKAKCLSIASAGDNSLALLTQDPDMVLAVDLSPAQIACVEIKKYAFAGLEYNDLLGFLGFKEPVSDRLNVYKKLRIALTERSRGFWDSNPEIISAGMIHQGKFENYFHLFRRSVLPLIHSKKKIGELLKNKEQRERICFYNEQWNNLRWRLLFKLFFNKLIMGRFGRDPEFFRYAGSFNMSDMLLIRTEHAVTVLPANKNPYLNYILTGNFGGILPFYVRKENFDRIRNNLDKLEIFHGTIDNALEAYNIKFDAFNLSDIFEYMGNELFYGTASGLIRHANKNARLSYWNMMVPRKVSDILPDKAGYLKEISEDLFEQDQAFFYRSFYVEQVI